MAAAQRQPAPTAFRAPAHAFATPALTAPRPQRTPVAPSRPPASVPRTRQQEHSSRMFLMILMVLAAAAVVVCGVVYLGGQASLTYEGYRHSKLQKMLVQERAMEQLLKHEQAALSTQSIIEQKAREQGMVKAAEGDAITAGVTTPPPSSTTHSGKP